MTDASSIKSPQTASMCLYALCMSHVADCSFHILPMDQSGYYINKNVYFTCVLVCQLLN